MSQSITDFNTKVIKPTECVKEGWELIKDQYWLFLGISFVGMLIGGAFAIVLMGPMMCGIFLCLFQRQRHQLVEFGMLFKGFDHFLQSLLVMLIKMIPIVILMVPFYLIMVIIMFTGMPREQTNPAEASRFLFTFFGFELVFISILMLVGILVEIFLMFAFPLVVDRRLPAIDAVKLSIKAGKENFGGVLGLLLLNALFGLVGMLCCFVGVYFYLPVAFASQVVAYRRIFPELGSPFPSPPPPPASWAA